MDSESFKTATAILVAATIVFWGGALVTVVWLVVKSAGANGVAGLMGIAGLILLLAHVIRVRL